MATSIRGDLVTNGPFLEAKEVIAGFYVLEAQVGRTVEANEAFGCAVQLSTNDVERRYLRARLGEDAATTR
jgi:hypothetical protein